MKSDLTMIEELASVAPPLLFLGAWLECTFCGARRPPDLEARCLECKGSLSARVPGRGLSPCQGARGLLRFADALPLGSSFVTLGEGDTPLLRLSRLFPDVEVYAKLEFVNPTGSFKDRGSALAVSAAISLGAEGVVCASTGNNAASVSAYAARAGLPCIVTMPEGAPVAKLMQAKAHGASTVETRGDFSDAYELASRLNQSAPNWANLTSTYLSPYATAAHATIFYELTEALGSIGGVVMPVGAGPMLDGVMAGAARLLEADQLDRLPIPIGVQGAGCAPIARAFEAGVDTVEAWPEAVMGIAGSINDALRGYPEDGARTLRVVRNAGGSIRAVSDDEIRSAMIALGTVEGIAAEPASAATLAALRKLDFRQIEGPIVLVISGHALKDGAAQPGAAEPSIRGDKESVDDIISAARARFQERVRGAGGI
jgi:threonine synthase